MGHNTQAINKIINRLFHKPSTKQDTRENKISYKLAAKPSSSNNDQHGLFSHSAPDITWACRLVVSKNNKPLHILTIKPNSEFIIGSHVLADLQLAGFRMADFHAKIIAWDDKCTIEVLQNSRDNFINGQRLMHREIAELKNNAVVLLNRYQLSVELPPKPVTIDQVRSEQTTDQTLRTNNILSTSLSSIQQPKNWTKSLTELTVTAIFNETHDTKTLRLSGNYPMLFHYQPGQYIILYLSIDGQEFKRSYSLASSPSRPYHIEITVKKVQNGKVSNWLHNRVNLGDKLKIKGPFGQFNCLHTQRQKILFIAAGSGIVPIMSMLRWITDMGLQVDVKVLLSFRAPSDIIYRSELKQLQRRHPNLDIKITITSPEIRKKDWSGQFGRINKTMLHKFSPDLHEREVFLCGPDTFMEVIQTLLTTLHLPLEQCHRESFTASQPDTPVVQARLTDSELSQRTGRYRVQFAKSGVNAVSDGQENLLSLALLYGINIDHECWKGSCGECMIKSIDGDIVMDKQVEISEGDKKAGWIYCCSAYPRSNIIIDA